jgi:hypothetical protein
MTTTTKKPVVIVEDVIIKPSEVEELKEMANATCKAWNNRGRLRKRIGGVCVICGDLPSKKLTYQESDEEQVAVRLEFYCQKCYDRLTTVRATNGIDESMAVRDNGTKSVN